MIPLDVQNLSTRLGKKNLHNHLSFQMTSREILGIVGGSGTGKSVLMAVILGLVPFLSGKISILGYPQQDLFKQDLFPQKIGVTFQSGALFSGLTVGENIAFPLLEKAKISSKTSRDLAYYKLALVGLSENDYHKYPAQLSGGMVKRVALARALALDPPLLFLDEPTSGLDPIGAASFDILIKSLRDQLNLTVMLITHDLDSIFSVCDRVGCLVDGGMIVDQLQNLIHHPHPWIQEYFNGPRGRILQGEHPWKPV
jgi:phospholipid/cholesterol/gamma-HCH transport system ATP-binding protein